MKKLYRVKAPTPWRILNTSSWVVTFDHNAEALVSEDVAKSLSKNYIILWEVIIENESEANPEVTPETIETTEEAQVTEELPQEIEEATEETEIETIAEVPTEEVTENVIETVQEEIIEEDKPDTISELVEQTRTRSKKGRNSTM